MKKNILLILVLFNLTLIYSQENDTDEIIGLWHISLIMPSGFTCVFQFYPNGNFDYKYSQMRQLLIIRSFSGKYEIEGNVLILKSETKRFFIHTQETGYCGAFGYQWVDATLTTEEFIREYHFPISNLLTVKEIFDSPDYYPKSMENREVITIGNRPFNKYSDNPNDYN